MVKVISNTEIICDEMTGVENRCEFFSLMANSQQCGNCPLMELGRKFVKTRFNDTIEGLNILVADFMDFI